MDAELRQQVNDLKAANDALLDGHGKMSIAYLSLRLSRLEDERHAADAKLRQRVEVLERSVRQLRDDVSQSKEIAAELVGRVEKAGRVVKELKAQMQGSTS